MKPAATLEFARIEAAHLAGLIEQFIELLDDSTSLDQDVAVQRLVPDAYREDAEAAREFRGLTQDDLLARRRADAAAVLAELPRSDDLPTSASDDALMETVVVVLSIEDAHAWLRTLAALRLVLATRLGIAEADHHDDTDPRFGVYDWLGYRLHLTVEAIESAT